MDYVLRLQALDGYQAKFDRVFGDRFSRVLCVHHTGKKGDNPHYHFCFTTDYQKQALRKYLNHVGNFDLGKGNKHLSLKNWDGEDEACSYLFHEGTQEIISRGFTDDQLASFKKKNTEIQAKMVRPHMVVDRAVKILSQKTGTHSNRDIFNVLFDIYKDSGEWLPNKFQWERAITKVRLELAKARGPVALNNLKINLFNELFPFG